ncbi:LCP family protein [Planosporangium sp. 12N6]|uniref:LCP family protein n=1 Tax=Planosporangium spinosum TaxID=3402278 RepID=UPI003CE95FB5
MAIATGALLMVVSGSTLIAGRLLLLHYTSGITRSGGLGTAAATDKDGGTSVEGPINLLLVGVDDGTGRKASDGARADSIIVAHIPATHDAIYLASIPRDSRVPIPAYPATGFRAETNKINAAFQGGHQNGGGRDGGLALLAETISNLTDGALTFNGAAIVNFDGFKDLVQAIGGVRMYVDEKVTSIHIGTNTRTGQVGVPYYIRADGTVIGLKPDMKPQVYEVGWHDFSDWEALDYVRQRDLLELRDSDYGRQRHQQQFLKAVLHKTASSDVLTKPTKVNAVLKSLSKTVSFYNNGVDIADWIFTLKDIRPDKMTMIKTNAGTFNPKTIGGIEYEELSPDSLQLLKSMAADDVGTFLTTHQSWIATDSPSTG